MSTVEMPWGLPWWFRVENLPSNAGDTDSIPGWEMKIPHMLQGNNRSSQGNQRPREATHTQKAMSCVPFIPNYTLRKRNDLQSCILKYEDG